ncbi:hypothetical protein HY772_05590 [Candidatus Woesearchaeota archaeon]|nr:hypothetical protein [Candidatus Woesearchaeota archaeon]
MLTEEAKARVLSEVAFIVATGNLRPETDDPSFAEPVAVENMDVLRVLRSLLSKEVGQLVRVFELTLDPNTQTFKGKAEQRITLGRSQYYGFTMTPERTVYKLIDSAAVQSFEDAEWEEAIEFAAAGKKLKCKPGNVQCGGKCQSGSLNCGHENTPAQRQKIEGMIQVVGVRSPQLADGSDIDQMVRNQIIQDRRTGTIDYLLLRDGKTYDDIRKESGRDAADEALAIATRKRIERRIESERLAKTIKDEREQIALSGSDRAKTELQAFDRLHGDQRGSTTLADWKKNNPELAKTLNSRYKEELRLDRQFSLESLFANGAKATKTLESKLSAEPSEFDRLKHMRAFRQQLLDRGMTSDAALKRVNDLEFAPSIAEQETVTRNAAQQFFQVTGQSLPSLIDMRKTTDRASADNEGGWVNIGAFTQPETIYHELGHHVEFSNPRIGDAARQWVDSRATGSVQQLSRMTGISSYRDNEVAKPDHFVNPYVGKIYGDLS